MRKIILAIREF